MTTPYGPNFTYRPYPPVTLKSTEKRNPGYRATVITSASFMLGKVPDPRRPFPPEDTTTKPSTNGKMLNPNAKPFLSIGQGHQNLTDRQEGTSTRPQPSGVDSDAKLEALVNDIIGT